MYLVDLQTAFLGCGFLQFKSQMKTTDSGFFRKSEQGTGSKIQ
jgi:hypothetical protein